MIYNYLLVFVLMMVCTGCGQNRREAGSEEPDDKIEEVLKGVEAGTITAGKRTEERRAKGDTLSLNPEQLQLFLPHTFRGYVKAEKLKGELSDSLNHQSISRIEQDYKNENGDKVKVIIIDYNGNYDKYVNVMSALTKSMDIDDENERARTFSIGEDIKGWEAFYKTGKRCKVVVGIVDRFYVAVESDNQENEEFTKEVLLDELMIGKMSSM